MEVNDNGTRIVRRSVTVKRPVQEVYAFWRNFENLPRYSEIVDDVPNQLIAWRSLPDSEIRNEGAVRFAVAPGDRGTEVRVELRYDAPVGGAGAAVAKLFGEEPDQQLRDDLRRFKQVLETGEVVLSDGSPEGAGQGAAKQRPAQPARQEARP